MTMGISSYGTATSLTSLLEKNQTQMTKLTNQLTSGNISSSLSGYGNQGSQVVNLNSSIAAANAYVATTNTVSTYLSGYDDTLTQLVNDATQLSQGIASLPTDGTSSSTASFTALVSGLSLDVTTTLNTQIGNRYLYSGTRYDTAPVQSIGSLTGPTTPTAFSGVSSPTLPAYDSQAGTPPVSDPSAYATQSVTIAKGETISYGVTSNDPSIQQLVFALQNAQAATTATDPDKTQYLDLAQSAAQQALSGLQAVQATNAESISQVTTEQTAQKQSVTSLTNMLDGVTQADSTTVAAEISSLQTQIEASYKATSTLLGLSLVNFLPASG